MAKKKLERGARSQAVRDYLAENPKASPKDVVAALKEKGVSVSLGLVSVIKYSKRSAGIRSLGKSNSSLAGLLHAKRFIDEVGGIEAAKEAIMLIERLR